MKHTILLLVAMLFFWSCKKEKIGNPDDFTIFGVSDIVLADTNKYLKYTNGFPMICKALDGSQIELPDIYISGIPYDMECRLYSSNFEITAVNSLPGVYNAKIIARNDKDITHEYPFKITVVDPGNLYSGTYKVAEESCNDPFHSASSYEMTITRDPGKFPVGQVTISNFLNKGIIAKASFYMNDDKPWVSAQFGNYVINGSCSIGGYSLKDIAIKYTIEDTTTGTSSTCNLVMTKQ